MLLMENISLSFVEIMAIATIVGAGMAAWVDIKVKITDLKSRVIATEHAKIISDADAEVLRVENQNQHATMMAKVEADAREIMRMLQENNIAVIKILSVIHRESS